jgi:multidrug efflux pump subunit AcrA (membrane-fusion protein)
MSHAKIKLRYPVIILCILALVAVVGYRFLDSIAKAGKAGVELALTVSSISLEKERVNEVLTFEGIAEGDPQVKVFPMVTGKFQENSVREGSFVKADSNIALINRDIVGANFMMAPVKSPIDGVVTKLYYMDRGAFVTQDKPVAEVADISNIKIPLNVGEEDLVRVKADMYAKVYFLNDSRRFIDTKVTSVTPFIDKDTLTGSIVVKGANANDALTIGMSVGIDITVGSRQMILVPEEALGMGADEVFVYKNDAGVARKVAVNTGYRKGGFVEITGNISAGDEVITVGSFKLFDGAAIRVLK